MSFGAVCTAPCFDIRKSLMQPFVHQPVLVREVLESMGLREGYVCFDGTVGGAGHSSEILKRTGETGFLYGMDRDETALAAAAIKLEPMKGRFALRHGNYGDVLDWLNPSTCDGALIDAGVSSPQIDQPERGFSFMTDGMLDMRMDRTSPLTAADIVNNWPEEELAGIFFHLGQEPRSRFIARKLVEERRGMKFRTTLELATFIEKACPRRWSRIHPATLVFQALRMEVNQEIPSLIKGLSACWELLKPGGRLAVISFHSLEHREMKQFGRRLEKDYEVMGEVDIPELRKPRPALARWIHKKAVCASDEEQTLNPRSRSAQLRVLEKLPAHNHN